MLLLFLPVYRRESWQDDIGVDRVLRLWGRGHTATVVRSSFCAHDSPSTEGSDPILGRSLAEAYCFL